MLFENSNGTFSAGPLDLIGIMKDTHANRYHAAFWEEHPMPGPVPDVKDVSVVRLKSKMHHTGGADTFEGALEHLAGLRAKIVIDDCCVITTEPVVERNFEVDGYADVMILPNWRSSPVTRPEDEA